MADASKGRGRLLEKYRQAKAAEAAAAAASAEAGPSGEPAPQAEPPKPIPCTSNIPKSGGRAQALQRAKESREAQKLGKPADAPARPPSSPTPEKGSKEASEKEYYEEAIEKLNISDPDPPAFSFTGTKGTPLRATTNYIHLKIKEDRGVYEYELKFDPPVDAKSNRFKLVSKALAEYNAARIYDGGALILFSSQLFPVSKSFDLELPTNPEEIIKVQFIFKKKVRPIDCIRIYNILFKRIMNALMYSRMGKNYFNSDQKRPIPQHNLDVIPGYAVTVDEMEGGLLLCLDTQHKLIRTQTVLQYLESLQRENPSNMKAVFCQNIINCIVITKYNDKTYKVDDIKWDMTPADKFEGRGGVQISFIDYYKNNYNVEIQNRTQPLLLTKVVKTINGEKVENMICLVPELSYITGLSDELRKDFRIMKDISAFTRLTPQQRVINLREYLRRVQGSEACRKLLADWGLELGDDTLRINARCLGNEDVFFGDSSKIAAGDWGNASTKRPVLGPINIHSWIVLYTPKDQRLAQQFADAMVRMGGVMGCQIARPQLIQLRNDRNESFVNALNENIKPNIQVMVCICPTARDDLYAAIKTISCCQKPIASQVILSKTLMNQKRFQSVVSKIALQINCKLGGTLWRVNIPAKGIMVCGIDVYHGTAKSKAVCGFTASLNKDFTKWFSEPVIQEGELGNFYRNAFKKALELYHRANGQFPDKIFIFRDGVGDGQLEAVRAYEIPQFKRVLEAFEIKPSFVFVVVQKRISTRIFGVSGSEASNPPCGTVVDTMVTRRNYYDYYLVPQTVTQGTVNPTHYIVLLNDGDISADIIQRLSYKLCHLYFNWSGTIRVPAPCQYSHKLAAIVGMNIRGLPSTDLCTVLWYL